MSPLIFLLVTEPPSSDFQLWMLILCSCFLSRLLKVISLCKLLPEFEFVISHNVCYSAR